MGNDARDQMAHLLRRAAFGPSQRELASGLQNGVTSTIDGLLSDAAPDASRFEYAAGGRFNNPDEMAGDWIAHLIRSSRPLHEKMTLFWHNHFATANNKVQHPIKMYHQNVLFRTHALGNFRELIHAVATDPAMLIWLDGVQNTRQAPNENFARELMELFTLGPGHYTEKDVQESARAFTGWGLQSKIVFDFVQYSEIFKFDIEAHDFGPKRFLGMTGRLNGHQIIDIVLSQPAAPAFIAKKLLTAFVYENPEDDLVTETARLLRLNDWELKPVMRFILTSDAFWSDRARGALIKSPVELVVGLMKQLDYPNPQGVDLAVWTRLMGQELFNPPSVKGWAGGRHWLNSLTYLKRFNFAGEVVRRRPAFGVNRLAEPLVLAAAMQPEQVVDRYLDLLGPLSLSSEERSALAAYFEEGHAASGTRSLTYFDLDKKARGLLQLIAATPHYHMN